MPSSETTIHLSIWRYSTFCHGASRDDTQQWRRASGGVGISCLVHNIQHTASLAERKAQCNSAMVTLSQAPLSLHSNSFIVYSFFCIFLTLSHPKIYHKFSLDRSFYMPVCPQGTVVREIFLRDDDA